MYFLNDIHRIPTAWTGLIHLLLVGLAGGAVVAAFLRSRRKANARDCVFWILGTLGITFLWLGFGTSLPDDARPFIYGYVIFIWAVAAFGCFMCWIRLRWPLRREGETKANGSEFAAAMACVTALGFLIAVLLPAVPSAREAAHRTQCKGHLKQIGLAFHNYADVEGQFPGVANNEPPFSWRVALLPYLDQKPLFEKYNFSSTWDSAENDPIAKTRVSVLQCPSRERLQDVSLMQDPDGRFYAHYAMIDGPGTVGQGVKLRDITDGTNSTLLVVEACGLNLVWTNPSDMNTHAQPEGVNLPSKTRGMSPGWISSHHTGGANILLADGSVRFISQNIDPKTLKSLTTIDAKDTVEDY